MGSDPALSLSRRRPGGGPAGGGASGRKVARWRDGSQTESSWSGKIKANPTGRPLRIGALTLDPTAHRAFADQKPLDLAPTEFRLLRVFMSHPDRVYSRGQLLDMVWRDNLDIGERTVDMHVSNLRKALETAGLGRLIQTVRGVGYRMSESA